MIPDLLLPKQLDIAMFSVSRNSGFALRAVCGTSWAIETRMAF